MQILFVYLKCYSVLKLIQLATERPNPRLKNSKSKEICHLICHYNAQLFICSSSFYSYTESESS